MVELHIEGPAGWLHINSYCFSIHGGAGYTRPVVCCLCSVFWQLQRNSLLLLYNCLVKVRVASWGKPLLKRKVHHANQQCYTISVQDAEAACNIQGKTQSQERLVPCREILEWCADLECARSDASTTRVAAGCFQKHRCTTKCCYSA